MSKPKTKSKPRTKPTAQRYVQQAFRAKWSVCRSCKRPMGDPEALDRTEQMLATSANALIKFMNFHQRSGPGSMPVVADRLIRFIEPDMADVILSEGKMATIRAAAEEYCERFILAGPLVVACAVGGKSYAGAARELGISDKTVKVIVGKCKGQLHAVFTEFGVFPLVS